MSNRKKSAPADPEPPFKKGDWITYARRETLDSKQYAPVGREAWVADETPTYDKSCSCGFRHRKVGADHFHRAAPEDLEREFLRLELAQKDIDKTLAEIKVHLLHLVMKGSQ